MFGVGWTEMLLIGVVALIVIGPKDLPVVMRQVGKVVGTIRRMGSEFQRELNKTTGLDQITDLRRTITEPLKQTAAEINREFNKINAAGETVPSGAIAPKTPGAESVVDEIHEKVGMSPAMAGTIAPPVMTGKQVDPAPVEAIAPVSKPRKPRAKKAATVARSADDVAHVVAASPARKQLAKAADAGPAPKQPRKRTPKPKAEA
jgi:sec-independent protein translocase protein TatB